MHTQRGSVGLVLGLWFAAVGCGGKSPKVGDPSDGARPTDAPAPIGPQPGQMPPPGFKVDGAPVMVPPGAMTPPNMAPATPPPAGDCAPRGNGKAYDVGPGKQYARIGDVPWNAVAPGDAVRVHHRPEPYREKVLLRVRATAEAPFRFCGVPGPMGQRPILEATDATTSANMRFIAYIDLQDVGLVIVSRGIDDPYASRPSHIVIENFVLRAAKPGTAYTASTGARRRLSDIAAGVSIIQGDNITVRNNEVTDNGNGIFVLSKAEIEQTVSRNIWIEGNHIHGNGVVGSYLQHNVYSQTMGVTFQFNKFGRLRPGAEGGNLKDRSAGTVIRYNWVEGAARVLDLVDAQEHAAFAVADPRYRSTFVYGNVLISGRDDALRVVHYGGDTQGYERNFRKGTLYFYNNTVLISANSNERYYSSVFEVSTNDENVDARNNVIHKVGTTTLRLLEVAGNLRLGPTWVTGQAMPSAPGFKGTVMGLDAIISGPDPMLDMTTLRPRAGSPLIDRSGPLAAPAAMLTVGQEYAADAKGVARTMQGGALDLGALEFKP